MHHALQLSEHDRYIDAAGGISPQPLPVDQTIQARWPENRSRTGGFTVAAAIEAVLATWNDCV
jgi:hypothetical protein